MLHADHELNASTFAARVVAGDAVRHPLGRRRGHRRAQGAAPRRRERRRHAGCCSRSARRRAGTRRGRRAREARAQGEDLRASATACTTPRIRARRTCARMSKELGREAGEPQWFEMSQRIEAVVQGREEAERRTWTSTRRRRIYALGIPIDLYTPIFAVSRVSGWTAHVLEQYANNRLIRPRSGIHRAAVSAAGAAARSAVGGRCGVPFVCQVPARGPKSAS